MRYVTVVRTGKAGDEFPGRSRPWRSMGGRTVALVLGILLVAGLGGAREAESAGQEGMPVQSGGMVWITTDAEFLSLDDEVMLPPLEGVPSQPALQGSLAFGVASPLPAWAVRVEIEPTAGPDGPIDVGCLMVRSPATGGEFVCVGPGIIIAHGQGPAPAEDLWLEVQARPGWTDESGLYQGLLHLTPVVLPEDHDSEIEHPGALRVVTGSAASLSSAFGPRLTVPVVMDVRPMTMVATSETEFNIETGLGPGRYVVEPDLDVVVATNEEQWQVVLAGTPFIAESGEIPLERVEWTMLDAAGAPGIWTAVGDDCCLVTGQGEQGVFSESFRLALDVIITDVAGEYVSEIHLVGSPR